MGSHGNAATTAARPRIAQKAVTESLTQCHGVALVGRARRRRSIAVRANCSQVRADSVDLSKSFASLRARLSQPKVRSTTHRVGRTTKPLTCLSVRLTIVQEILLASKAARWASSPL